LCCSDIHDGHHLAISDLLQNNKSGIGPSKEHSNNAKYSICRVVSHKKVFEMAVTRRFILPLDPMGISLKIEAYGTLWEFVLSSGIEIGKFKLVAQTRFAHGP
jgi:hypothetical protein